MKAFNIKSWAQSPRVQKWGLFGMLALSLGFNLSMNPEHFNNIARHEKPEVFQSNEMASEDKAAAPVPATAVAPTTASQQFIFVGVGPNKNTFNARVREALNSDGSKVTYAEFEGKFCSTCDKSETHSIVLAPSIVNLQEVLLKELNDKLGTTDTKAATAEVKLEKKGERTTADLEAIAKKCDAMSGLNSAMNCHKNSLIALSRDLKDSSETEELLKSYFIDNIKSFLEAGFKEPTIDALGERTEGLERSRELTKELVAGLRGKNGRAILLMLPKLQDQSFRAQLAHARRFVENGILRDDPMLISYGMDLMRQSRIEPELRDVYQSMNDALGGNRGISEADKVVYRRNAEATFFRPAQDLMYRLGALNRTVPKQGQNLGELYAQFPINTSGLETVDGFQNTPSYPGTITGRYLRGDSKVGHLWAERMRALGSPHYTTNNLRRLDDSQGTACNASYSPNNPYEYSRPSHCGRNPTRSARQ